MKSQEGRHDPYLFRTGLSIMIEPVPERGKADRPLLNFGRNWRYWGSDPHAVINNNTVVSMTVVLRAAKSMIVARRTD